MQIEHQLPDYVGSARKKFIIKKIGENFGYQSITLANKLIIDLPSETDKLIIFNLGALVGTLINSDAV